MKVTANVVYYTSKTLANGEHPLMIRYCKDGKKKYKSLGISVNPQFWNFEKNKLKTSCPNYQYIKKLINDTEKELTEQIVKLKSEKKELTISSLADKDNKKVKPKTVDELFQEQIARLELSGRNNYAKSVKQLYNSLLEYNGHLDIVFSELDITWLRKYEVSLREKELAENTIGIRFRTLRAIYNIAIDENAVSADPYPFKKMKVSKLHQDTAKRALTKEDVERVLAYTSSNRYMKFPVDLFAFTYYCGGINFVDIANLTNDNIQDGKIVYKRQKTKKLIKIPLQPQAIELIKKYSKRNPPYLFPILSTFHKTDVQKANRIHKVISNVNRRLRDIGEELKLPLTLTTYVARHSQATVMKKAGVSTAVIKEIMGHSSEKVTQIYLDSFDNEQIDEAMKSLL